MTVDLHPFRAFRPRPELAEKVASPPYDVLNSAEAREMAGDNPLSFLHVVKPEIDLDPSVDIYDDQVYAKGKENLDRLLRESYQQDAAPCLYVYQQKMGEHVQAGIVAGASVFDYEQDRIKKHELTREVKEKDRIRHVKTLGAHTGPVFLTYKANKEVDAIVAQVRAGAPTYDFVSPDGIGHTLWVVDDAAMVERLVGLFAPMDCLYVADGHHRSAAGTAVAKERRDQDAALPREHEINYFLAVVFPHDQMKILDYNRVVKDLNGLTEAEFLAKVEEKFEVKEVAEKRPDRARCFGMYLGGKWYRLSAREGSFDAADPVRSLDVSILQLNLLAPILGVQDPRTDKRVDFVGGIRGPEGLEKRCREDMEVAFSMYPTSMEQLMAIADAGEIMPPKSTWFEPKLRSGLIVHAFDF